MNVRTVLQQLEQLLKEQSKGDALVPELAMMDDAKLAEVVSADVKANATNDQEFPKAKEKEKEGGGGGGEGKKVS